MIKKSLALLVCIVISLTLFTACKNSDEGKKITDVLADASAVFINGEQSNTVEARLGAFEGSQGDYIEFRFPEKREFNTIYVIEKTATVRQFNIYAEIDGKYALVYTGKNILSENIAIDTVTATAFKLEVVNTDIGNNHFIIQGISAYKIEEETTNVN